MSLRLYKTQKLCSTVAISMLFGHDATSLSAMAYPLRAVWRVNPGRTGSDDMQFMISVPKKRLRHAVDRVKMRRRIREAYRLLHQQYHLPAGCKIDLAFVYIASDLQPYAKVYKAVDRILAKISAHDYAPTVQSTD